MYFTGSGQVSGVFLSLADFRIRMDFFGLVLVSEPVWLSLAGPFSLLIKKRE